MIARLSANENFPLPVVIVLRELGHDVVTTRDAGQANDAISDEEVLRFAVENGRAVMTHHRQDFMRLDRENPDHEGILVCTGQSRFSRARSQSPPPASGDGISQRPVGADQSRRVTRHAYEGAATTVHPCQVALGSCTVAGNFSTGDGSAGGIAVLDGSTRVSNCTISGNTGKGGGGGLFLQTGAVVAIESCLIAGNSDPIANDVYFNGGTLDPSGANLIGSNATAANFFPTGLLVGTQTAPLDPKLSLLGYFGGPTMTMHPLVGSLAIDAGGAANPGGTDGRGFPRFVDGDANGGAQLDIGAVEAGPLVTVSSVVDGSGNNLRSVIANNAITPGTHIVFLNGFSTFPFLLFNGEISVANRTIFIDGSNQAAPVTISAQNNSRVFGIDRTSTVAIQNLTITRGKAPQATAPPNDGNGGAIRNQGTLSLLACTLSQNVSATGESFADGPTLYSSGAALVSGCTFSSNHCEGIDETGAFAGVGGAILNDADGLLTVRNSTLSGNAGGTGYIGGAAGAIFNRGNAVVSVSTFSGNSAGNGTGFFSGGAGRGGAIFNEGSMRVLSSTLNGNAAGLSAGSGGSGGAIYNKGTLTVATSTLTNNACGIGAFGSGGSGGAIFGENTPLEVNHCTIAGNFASQGGGNNGVGGGIFQAGFFALNNTIVAKNFLRFFEPPGESESNLAGSTPSGSANLTSGDPKLAPLSDYGGPTFTMLPLPGSPALNAASGSTALLDQRGLGPNGVPDIGAVEVQPVLTGFTDTDADGMDDRLEALYGFTVGLPDGALDADGDGSKNRDELGNKTGPRDAASLLKIVSFQRIGANLHFTWTSFPGLSYTAQFSSNNLSFGSSLSVGTATGMTTSQVIGPVNGPSAFLRVSRD